MFNMPPGASDRPHSLEPESDDNFVALADTASDLVCTTTLDGYVRFVNTSGRISLGLGNVTAPSPQGLVNYIHPDDQGLATSLVSDVITKGCERRSQLRFRHQTTGAVIVMSCHLFRLKRGSDSDVLTAAVVGRDIDEVPRDGMASLDPAAPTRLTEMFAAIVGHDLRNPLNAILYISNTLASQRTIQSVQQRLARYDERQIALTIVDVSKQSPNQAEEHRIVVTPTLLKTFPAPNVWIAGELNQLNVLERLLEQAGVNAKH